MRQPRNSQAGTSTAGSGTSGELGAAIEAVAQRYLETRGLALVTSNYHSTFGEIDLIMMDKTDLDFVEVRYRRSSLFGGAARSVDQRKQGRIRRTAEAFLQANQSLEFQGCRFDVVAVKGDDPDFQINWIADAFQA